MAVIEIIDGFKTRQESSERRNAQATRVFLCDWTERLTAAALPTFDDVYPDDAGLKCVRINREGYGQTTADAANPYTHAKVTVEYSNLALASDGEGISSGDFGGDVLEVGGGRYFVSDGSVLDQPVNLPLLYRSLAVNKTVILPNWGAIYACYGKCNAYMWAPSSSPVFFAPGHVRFDGVSDQEEYDALTGVRTRLVYKFMINPVRTWNEIWRSDILAWDFVYPYLCEPTDFSALMI
jgi:hypothetical protein